MPVSTRVYASLFAAVLFLSRATCSLSAEPALPESPADPKREPLVAAFADPENWQISGANNFSANAIRQGVVQTSEYLELSYPGSSPADFSARMKKLIERGYRHKGYAESSVAVSSAQNDRALTIRIHEGPRYRSGQVTVIGADRLNADRISTWCATVTPETLSDFVLENDEDGHPLRIRKQNGTIVGPDNAEDKATAYEHPVWSPGRHISLASHNEEWLISACRRAFEEQGFFQVQFTPLLVPDPKTKTITLRLLVHEEGPQTRLGKITIDGLEKIDEQQLLDHLNLKPGQLIGREQAREIESQLRTSAMFLRFSCIVVPRILELDTADIFIDVREPRHVIPLDRPLSVPQRTLVRLSRWIEQQQNSEHDLILKMNLSEPLQLLSQIEPHFLPETAQSILRDADMRIVLASDGNMLLEKSSRDGTAVTSILATGKRVILSRPGGSQIVTFEQNKVPRPVLQVSITGSPINPKDLEIQSMFGIGILGNQPASNSVRILPGFGIRELAEGHLVAVPDQPGFFRVPAFPDSYLRVDPDSGRLIDARIGFLSISTRRGEFQRQLDKTLASLKSAGVQPRPADDYETWKWIASTAATGLHWMAGSEMESPVELFSRLSDQQIWTPFIRTLSELFNQNRFHIPADKTLLATRLKAQLIQQLLHQLVAQSPGSVSAQLVNVLRQTLPNAATSLELFPYGSLPWQVNRDMELLLIDQSAGAERLLARLKSADFGPVSGVYTTLLMSRLSSNVHQTCAQQCLTKLYDFQRDREWLLRKNSLTESILLSTAETFRRLTTEEIISAVKKISGQQLTPEQAKAIRGTLPESLAEPVGPFLPGFTTAVWQFAFQDTVRNYLEAIVLNNRPLKSQAQQLAMWGMQKQSMRQYAAARTSLKRSLELFEKHLEQSELPGDSRQAHLFRATALYMLAVNHDLRTADRAELLQMQTEIQKALTEQLSANRGIQLTSLPSTAEQKSGQLQVARLSAVTGLVAVRLGQENTALLNMKKALSLYHENKQSANPRYATLACHYALLLATCSSEPLRDTATALQIARTACEQTQHSDTDCLSLCAAIEAQNGDYDSAIKAQRLAIQSAPSADRKT